MHAISFHAKRCHLRTWKLGLEMMEKVAGMTPARYDILSIVRKAGRAVGLGDRSGGGISQSAIGGRLDLAPSTISKMLKRLFEMGWIYKARDPEDRRARIVSLSTLGFQKIRKAMRIIERQRPFLKLFERAARLFRPTVHVLEGLDYLRDVFDGVARFCGDTSCWFYNYGSRTEYGPSRLQPRRQFTHDEIRRMRILEERGELDIISIIG